jgi:peptidoglycan/xylan/chitin deacetylase (PgdA/CDA1 family)
MSVPSRSVAGSCALGALRRIARRRPVILGYHGVGRPRLGDDLARLQVTPERFRAQLELMLSAGFRFVTVAELALELGDGPPPPGLAAVSFDDGLRNNRTTALPILQQLGIPATVYVTIDFIGGRNPWLGPDGDAEMLTAEEIVDLARAGWEIGAHTISHPDLSALDYDACRTEIEGSALALERIAGTKVLTLAYPFGRYGAAAINAARDSGLRAAVSTGSGSWAPYELTRAMISAGDPLPVTLLKMTDRYEPLLQVPALRRARAASKRVRQRIATR